MRRGTQGFTLIEMLVVMAVVGILTALGFWQFGKIRQKSELQQAQLGFVQDLDRGRQNARRYNVNYAVRIDKVNNKYSVIPVKLVTTITNPGPPIVSTTTWQPMATADGNYPKIEDRLLENKTTFAFASGKTFSTTDNWILYTAPFARVEAIVDCISVVSDTLMAEVNSVGVTGKAIPRAIREGSDYCATN